MRDNATPKPIAPTTKAQIRRAAVLGAFYIWCAGIIIGLCLGKNFSQAFSNGSAAALGGFVGWTVYHIVSRRTDGLAFIGMNMFPIMGKHDAPFLLTLAISLVVMVPIAWIAGLTTRRSKPEPTFLQSTDPLYDADVDEGTKRPAIKQEV